MNVDRWQKLEQIYHGAIECDTKARDEFLQRACGEDDELRREAESLLAQAEGALASACMLLAFVAALAGLFPAWKAMKVDPMVALRHD